VGLHPNKELLHSQRKKQQYEKTTCKNGKIFVNHTADKKLLSQINKELIQLSTKKTNKLI
jgi:hypothetical protein